ncbi:unnamed protein product [Owenia fusiformis]|uniref:F-box domain-containing protein n=1 Tax=Owenia fusiformis TaxID=6347 RepID=A0A8S4Q854_OWEFU|nr:unnamed protein product [Owenia fusiformis]
MRHFVNISDFKYLHIFLKMDVSKRLESFREAWKNELNAPKRGSSSGCQSNSESHPSTTQNNEKETQKQNHFENENPEKAKEKSGSFDPGSWYERHVKEAELKENTIEPFLIAEKLLSGHLAEHSISNTPTSTHSEIKPHRKVSHHKELDTLTSNSDIVHHNRLEKNKTGRSSPLDFKSKRRKLDGQTEEGNLVDTLIADLDEINEIPFFDIQIPREVAVSMFKYLEPKDLCRCAQVSKAWQSLAEDELLWCTLSHRAGYDLHLDTVAENGWKQRFKDNLATAKNLQNNWRERIGEYSPLQFIKGGVLCSAHSHGSQVVAGYTSGHVKYWDLSNNDECIFQPSNTSLVIDPNVEQGTLGNIVTKTHVNSQLTSAGYSLGNVDIWYNKEGSETTPVHTFNMNKPIRNLHGNDDVIIATSESHLRVEHRPFNQEKWTMKMDMHFPDQIQHMNYTPTVPQQDFVTIATGNRVQLVQPWSHDSHMTTLHNLIGSSITTIATSKDVLAVALRSLEFGVFQADNKCRLYCMRSGKETQTLNGSTGTIRAISLDLEGPMLVMGSDDRRVRIYDLRCSESIVCFTGHQGSLKTVEMSGWKIISGDNKGQICLWDQRMQTKLWDLTNSHPVEHCKFDENYLIAAHVPLNKQPEADDFDSIVHRRDRGLVFAYNFNIEQASDVPSICTAKYDVPESYNYNINLVTPYDAL